MLTVSSITIGNTLRATCLYQQEALDKSIGAYTNNCAVSIYANNSEDIASKTLFLHYKVCFMLNSKIDIINRNILMLLYLMHAVIEVSRLDSI